MKQFREVKEGECFYYKDKLYCKTKHVKHEFWYKNGVSNHTHYNCFNLTDGRLDNLAVIRDVGDAYSFDVEPTRVTEVVTEDHF